MGGGVHQLLPPHKPFPSCPAREGTAFASCQLSSTADCETDGYLSSSGFLDSPDLAHRSFVAVDPTSPPPSRPVRCFPTVSTGSRGLGAAVALAQGSCGIGSGQLWHRLRAAVALAHPSCGTSSPPPLLQSIAVQLPTEHLPPASGFSSSVDR